MDGLEDGENEGLMVGTKDGDKEGSPVGETDGIEVYGTTGGDSTSS